MKKIFSAVMLAAVLIEGSFLTFGEELNLQQTNSATAKTSSNKQTVAEKKQAREKRSAAKKEAEKNRKATETAAHDAKKTTKKKHKKFLGIF